MCSFIFVGYIGGFCILKMKRSWRQKLQSEGCNKNGDKIHNQSLLKKMYKDKLEQLIEDLYWILDRIRSGKISEETGLPIIREMINDFKKDNNQQL